MIKENFDNNGYDYVDLGLPSGTLWATMNVGASNPLDYGLYFKWGDTKGYAANQAEPVYTLDNYKLSTNNSDRDPFTKYNSENAILKLEDDAAHVHMGGDWHMPSPEQIKELINNTTSEWITLDNVSYMTFTSKKDTSKSIFIPAAGYTWISGLVHFSGRDGNLWSSMLSDSQASNGYTLYFDSNCVELGTDDRSYKFPVRGVIDKKHDNSKEKKSNMNENLNLVEILKDAPKGTKLWSPVCGDCELDNINRNASYYPIECISKNLAGYPKSVAFTANGKSPYYFANGECVLFPSKDNKDWSTFKVSKKHKLFRTYQKVLVRELVGKFCDKAVWMADEYSHYDEDLKQHYCTRAYGFDDDEIMPYEGNEDKVGTIAE